MGKDSFVVVVVVVVSGEKRVAHPFCKKFHDPKNEPDSSVVIQIPVEDNKKYTAAEYREKLYNEISKKRRDSNARQRGTGSKAT